MVEEQDYQIVITSTAERAYFEVLDYVFEHHSKQSANSIALELLEHPQILKKFPNLGTIEANLKQRSEKYRFILFERTTKITVKIIYYVDEENKKIYLTDFFPCEMNEQKIRRRK
ncbi:MAG: hypothetical protein V4622_09185 [Bacteroidota bacterium]